MSMNPQGAEHYDHMTTELRERIEELERLVRRLYTALQADPCTQVDYDALREP